MLGVVRRAALPYRGAPPAKRCWAGAVLRRLAAIGAVRGYLRPVEADREGTLARLGSLRRNLLDPKFALHKGRTLKTTSAVQAAPIAAG